MAVTTKLTTYPTAVDNTITLASLASDTNLLAGREGTAVDNTSNLFLDYILTGKITTGTTPTVNTRIELWLIPKLNLATPAWPDGFTGADSNRSPTSRNTLFAICPQGPIWIATVTATTGIAYPIGALSVAKYFGGTLPPAFVPFVVHNTAVALNSTAGNHILSLTGISATTT